MFYGGVVNPCKIYTYEDLVKDSIRLTHSYSGIINVKTIGLSVEKRNILRLSLGKGQKKILLCGAHHGREYISAAYLMKMAEEYALYYKNRLKPGGYDARLLDEVSLDIVPMVNPDGVAVCQRGLKGEAQPLLLRGMHMTGSNYSEWKANARGVDLNRQYPCLWERLRTGIDVPASGGFKGYAPASEPEVATMMRLCTENEYVLSASFHTKGEEIYYADSLTHRLLPDAYPIALKLSGLTGYALAEVSQNPAVYAGGFENWFRMLFRSCAFLIELTPYNHTNAPHDDNRFEELVWDKAAYAGLLLADEARLLTDTQ